MLLTVHDWVTWFEQSEAQAGHLVRTQRALQAAGLCDDPETVIEIGRYIFADPQAATKLRSLADAWERIDQIRLVPAS